MKHAKLITAAALLSACVSTQGGNMNKSSIYVYESGPEGFNTKTLFLDNGEEVVAFDAQFTPALAQASLEFLKTKTSNPVTHLVLTHPNPDKFNGASVFKRAGAKIIASELTARNIEGTHAYKKYFFVNIAKMFKESGYPTPTPVDETFGGRREIRLTNGDKIELLETGLAGVSTNQTVAFIPGANALIVGDLVHHGVHAWLEGGISGGQAVPTVATWVKNLELLMKEFGPDVKVFGGRGEIALASEAIPAQIAYLKKSDALVTSYVKKLGPSGTELLGDKAGEHHAALTREFEIQFPGLGLSYMIQYGVYGLANSKIAQ